MPISSQAMRAILWKVQRLGRDTLWVNNVHRPLKRGPKRLAPHRVIEGEDIVRHSGENLRITCSVVKTSKHEFTTEAATMLNILENTGPRGVIAQCTRCNVRYSVKCKSTAQKSPVGHLCKKCKTFISSMVEPTQEKLLDAFVYYPFTGEVRHKHTTLSGKAGDLATFNHSGGYLNISVGKKQLLAHRVIYMMVTGNWPKYIDHINHIRSDNRWCNLRSVEQADNNRNMRKQYNCSSGITGVSLHPPTNKYRAYITYQGKSKHLGLFECLNAAIAARKNAEIQYGYHANHGK